MGSLFFKNKAKRIAKIRLATELRSPDKLTINITPTIEEISKRPWIIHPLFKDWISESDNSKINRGEKADLMKL
jgi:hypothetical protein